MGILLNVTIKLETIASMCAGKKGETMFKLKFLNELQEHGINERDLHYALIGFTKCLELMTQINIDLIEVEKISDNNKIALITHDKINERLSRLTADCVEDSTKAGILLDEKIEGDF